MNFICFSGRASRKFKIHGNMQEILFQREVGRFDRTLKGMGIFYLRGTNGKERKSRSLEWPGTGLQCFFKTCKFLRNNAHL